MTSCGELRIRSGCHEGATVSLGEAALSVGSDPSCDVVLSDAGLAPHHFTLRGGRDGRDAMIVARDGSVRIDDEIEVAPGFRAMLRGSAALLAGPVRMELVLTPAAATTPPPARPRIASRTGVLVPALICAGLLIGCNRPIGTLV